MRRAVILACLAMPLSAQADEITVFAAASLGDAMTEAADTWSETSGTQVTVAPAGSSVLARQIAAGAPADLFISANADWMDWLTQRDLVRQDSRRVLMSNALVLVATGSGDGAAPAEITAETDIAGRLGDADRLAMALVDAVPAGIYGREALHWLGQWDALRPRIAQADNVRAALALVALGEAPLGIVYATDAAAEPRVHVVGTFPEESHAPILYPGAVTRDAVKPDAAQAFLDWLAGEQGQAILTGYGFGPPPR